MLVGRDRELAELTKALEQIATAGALYLFSGEPGIGKTRLASEVAAVARAQGVRASWGRCWEAGGAPPFWPWREALEGCGITFPGTAAIATANLAEARFALFREVTVALGREATRQPLLITLEDLHAADLPTLVLLEFVAGQLRSLPVVLVGTYRDLEARLRPDASEVLSRLGRLGRTMQLSALTEADVATILGDAIRGSDERLATKVYEITHGNPLFVDEMVRDIRARGLGQGISIPLGVREVIQQRLRRVPEAVRPMLDAAAVLGVEVGLAVLGHLVGDIEGVLDDAVKSGLVNAEHGRLRFSHSLYREGLYHELPRLRRQALHREAARALTDSDASLEEIAHHLLESGPDVAAEAIDHAVRAAGHAVDVFAFEEAIALLERADSSVPAGPLESLLRCRVLIARGEALLRSGNATGREVCAKAVGIARELSDAELLAHAGLAYGSVLMMGGVDPFLVGVLEEALSRLPKAETAFRARVMARLASARQPSAPEFRQRDIVLAHEAIAMARRVAGRRELLTVLHSASGTLYGAADPNVRVPITREQERLAEELGDTARLLNARVRLACDYLELGDFASYEALASSYEALAQRVGPAAEPWRVPLMRSMLALRADRFDESLRWQDESRRIDSEQPRAKRAQAFHRICFFRAAERHGDLRASIPELKNLWLAFPYGVVLAESRVASVLARLGADDELRELLRGLPEQVWGEEINLPALSEAVWATRDRARAKQLLAMGQPYRTRWMMYWFDCEITEAPLMRALAYLAGITGDWQECDRMFEQALRAVEAVGRRSMAARMKFELGDLFVREGRQPERASALLSEARALAADIRLPDLVALIDRRHPTLAAPSGHNERSISASSSTSLWPKPSAAPAFSMVAEGEYFAVATLRGTLRFKATRGMQYLARLVDQPNVAIHVLELAGSSDHPDRGDAGELLDPKAFRDYRARLETLREVVEDAEARGDVDRAEQARDEMETIAGELARASGRGGRARRGESAVDRARSAVQRRIKDAIGRVTEQDAELGVWLDRAVTTGNHCIFRPNG